MTLGRLETLTRRLTLAATITFVVLLAGRVALDLAAPAVTARVDSWAGAGWLGTLAFAAALLCAVTWIGTLLAIAAVSARSPRPDHGAGVADAG